MSLVGSIAAVLLALTTGLSASPILNRLVEPLDDPDIDQKIPYRNLAHRTFTLVVMVVSLGAGLITFNLVPPAGWFAWAGLAGVGALAIAIDGATTWMPKHLLWVMWAWIAVGVAIWAIAEVDPWVAIRACIGAVGVGGFFYLFWFFTGGIGFSDVRLMAGAGAVAAATSIPLGLDCAVVGCLVGAVWAGCARWVNRRRQHASDGVAPIDDPDPSTGGADALRRTPMLEAPFGPGLWSGPFLTLLWLAVLN